MLSRLFSNYLKIIKIKDRRLCWISYWKIYNLLKIEPNQNYFTLKWFSNIYLSIFMLSWLFSNYLKIIKSKIVDCVEFYIENLQSAKNQTGMIIFHLKITQKYIIMYSYVIKTVFKLFKNHKNQRSHIVLNFILKIYNLLNIKPDRYFFTPK